MVDPSSRLQDPNLVALLPLPTSSQLRTGKVRASPCLSVAFLFDHSPYTDEASVTAAYAMRQVCSFFLAREMCSSKSIIVRRVRQARHDGNDHPLLKWR